MSMWMSEATKNAPAITESFGISLAISPFLAAHRSVPASRMMVITHPATITGMGRTPSDMCMDATLLILV
jgi:hypothetical protein